MGPGFFFCLGTLGERLAADYPSIGPDPWGGVTMSASVTLYVVMSVLISVAKLILLGEGVRRDQMDR